MNVDKARKILEENLDLMIRKNKDYSGNKGDNITAGGVKGVAVRLLDKVTRLNNLLDSKGDVNFESVDDTLNDISNYGLIGRLLREDGWKNPPPSLVYLAGPIDDISITEARTWRMEFMQRSIDRNINISFFDPSNAFIIPGPRGSQVAEQVAIINRKAIVESDMVLANLSGPGMAFGTIREIEYARALGIPVVVICPKDKAKSLYFHDIIVVEDISMAVEVILG